MDEIQAAVLDVKLPHLDEDNNARRAIADIYYNGIKNTHVTLPVRLEDKQNVYHLFPVFCEHRDELQEYLKEQGIETLIHYPIPPHKQECYSQWSSLSLPVTEKIHSQELSLPISQVMTADEADEVVRAINAFRKNV
jgi:dTDP-4-amino-4,6-dideoxygalactose transaminase